MCDQLLFVPTKNWRFNLYTPVDKAIKHALLFNPHLSHNKKNRKLHTKNLHSQSSAIVVKFSSLIFSQRLESSNFCLYDCKSHLVGSFWCVQKTRAFREEGNLSKRYRVFLARKLHQAEKAINSSVLVVLPHSIRVFVFDPIFCTHSIFSLLKKFNAEDRSSSSFVFPMTAKFARYPDKPSWMSRFDNLTRHKFKCKVGECRVVIDKDQKLFCTNKITR